MTPVRLSKNAANYIRREADYLRQRNPAAARGFSLAIKDAKRTLQSFPQAGNKMHGLQIAGGLTLVMGDYLLDYSYDGKQVDIVAVRHGRMVTPAPDADLDGDL
ncbi:type II toxin-antitoxin system RelE/ParE family toxin [Rhizobium sp. C4]|uniref:type II toxin-antitoxin system RelE/ParE family toxin n=1 Tax=Rhizobium sp. C4 TaxID=1349800 RepID=UPI001E5D5B67|nr:type II toxin-antitoxin system RelE/ParE family toxin [Rhizobium sp. C4]MCD2173015.1 type II toxin-antitoxin system RelE/ParE family toxin [Rhizobium sp. C4]